MFIQTLTLKYLISESSEKLVWSGRLGGVVGGDMLCMFVLVMDVTQTTLNEG